MNVRRLWVAGVVLVAVIALLPFSFHAERHLETATRVEGSEAEVVSQELADRFHSPFVDRVVLVVQGLPPADSDEGEQALATIVAALREEPGVSGVVSHIELRDPIFLGRGGGTFVLVGLAPTDGPVESLVPKLHQRADALANQLRGRYPNVKLELTGEIPLNFGVSQSQRRRCAPRRKHCHPRDPRTLAMAFGSLVAALIPLAVGQLPSRSLWRSPGSWVSACTMSWSEPCHHAWAGPGHRLRAPPWSAASAKQSPPGTTAPPSLAHRGTSGRPHAFLISASTVAIGFLALLTVPISEIRSIGIAGFLVAGISVLLTNTLVPVVMGWLGADRRRPIALYSKLDADRAARTGSLWRQWGRVIVAHPWLALLLAGAPLLLLAWQATRLDTSLPKGNWLPQSTESVHALHTLEQMDRAGVVQSLRVIVELPADAGSISQTDVGWNAIDRLSKRLASDPRCARVISITTIAEGTAAPPSPTSRARRAERF